MKSTAMLVILFVSGCSQGHRYPYESVDAITYDSLSVTIEFKPDAKVAMTEGAARVLRRRLNQMFDDVIDADKRPSNQCRPQKL